MKSAKFKKNQIQQLQKIAVNHYHINISMVQSDIFNAPCIDVSIHFWFLKLSKFNEHDSVGNIQGLKVVQSPAMRGREYIGTAMKRPQVTLATK